MKLRKKFILKVKIWQFGKLNVPKKNFKFAKPLKY